MNTNDAIAFFIRAISFKNYRQDSDCKVDPLFGDMNQSPEEVKQYSNRLNIINSVDGVVNIIIALTLLVFLISLCVRHKRISTLKWFLFSQLLLI